MDAVRPLSGPSRALPLTSAIEPVGKAICLDSAGDWWNNFTWKFVKSIPSGGDRVV
jgi:hypothetical protein